MLRCAGATIAIACALVFTSCAPPQLPQQTAAGETEGRREIRGPAIVTDGDTIRIDGRPVRLRGIDAPERGSVCGGNSIYDEARAALQELAGDGDVVCVLDPEPDRYGRDVGACQAGETDINAAMVRRGMARDWPRYSNGAYAGEEAQARRSRLGIWSASCPADLWGERDYSR